MAAHLRLVPAADSVSSGRPALPIRVVLAIDHALLRRSLHALIAGEDDVEVVATTHDLEAAARCVRANMPHVLAVDVAIADCAGPDAIAGLRVDVPQTEVVVLTMEESPL